MSLLATLLLASLAAADPADDLARAAELHAAGEFEAAAALYDRLAQQAPRGGRFYLNQGNAHFLAGHLPEALLAYRRAERTIPNDPRLRANLAEARGLVLDPLAPPPDGEPAWLPRLSRPLRVRLALAGYTLAWAVLAVGAWRGGWWPAAAAGVLLTGALLCGLTAARAEWRDERNPLAVVAADGVVLRTGNGEAYPAHLVNGVEARLNRGVEARARGQRKNGWVQLELANGMVGWVPRSAVLLDREPPVAQ